MGGAVSLPVIYLGPNYGGGNEDNGDLLQKVPCTSCYTQCFRPCSRPPLTHASTGDSWTLTGKSRSVSFGVTAPFTWVLVHKVLFVLDWMKHKLESRLPGEISITSDMQMMPPIWQKVKMKVKESEKVVLKLNIQKTKIIATSSITSWQIDGES